MYNEIPVGSVRLTHDFGGVEGVGESSASY